MLSISLNNITTLHNVMPEGSFRDKNNSLIKRKESDRRSQFSRILYQTLTGS